MNCPQCSLPTEEGAAFCGNCGQALRVDPSKAPAYGQRLASLALQEAQPPAYAHSTPEQHRGDVKAVLSLTLGVVAFASALFAAAAGIGVGLAGVVLGTLSRRSPKRLLSTAGIVVSSVAIVASIGLWSYLISRNNQAVHAAAAAAKTPDSTTAVAANSVTTACYTAGFATQLNIATANNSCNMEAYNGTTLNTSTQAYKVYGYNQPTVNSGNFLSAAKPAIEQDIAKNLTGFTINSESVGEFDGSQAYVVQAVNASQGVAYVEAAVFHPSLRTPDNIYVFVYANTGNKTDLSGLEAGWSWK